MSKQPLSSIGVPVYNGGKYLEECLQSILDQTYTNWECVIVDNKSTDETNAIAKSFVSKDSRFRLVENDEFVDQTTNWNISFRESDPDAVYFKIVPADDWIFPEYLEKMIDAMEKHPSTGICSSYRIDDRRVGCDYLDIYEGQKASGREVLVEQLLYNMELTGSINTVLFRVDVLKKIAGSPDIFEMGVYHIDTDLAYKVQNISDQAFVFQVLSYTRRHNETYTSQISNRFQTILYLREKELFRYLELDPRLESEYKKVRTRYALFLLTKKMQGDKECIQWHRKYLDKARYVKWHESLRALLIKVFYKVTFQINRFY